MIAKLLGSFFLLFAMCRAAGAQLTVSVSPGTSSPTSGNFTFSLALTPPPTTPYTGGKCTFHDSSAGMGSGGSYVPDKSFTWGSFGTVTFYIPVSTFPTDTWGVTCTDSATLASGYASFTVTGGKCSATDISTADNTHSPSIVVFHLDANLSPAGPTATKSTPDSRTGHGQTSNTGYQDCDGDPIDNDVDTPPTLSKMYQIFDDAANQLEYWWNETDYQAEPGDKCGECDANPNGHEDADVVEQPQVKYDYYGHC